MARCMHIFTALNNAADSDLRKTHYLMVASQRHGYGNIMLCKVHVKGLKGLDYFDNTDGIDGKTESDDLVTINGEVDRIYKSAGDTLHVCPSQFTFRPLCRIDVLL